MAKQKNYYIVCFDSIKTGDVFPKHYAYVLKANESRNIVDLINKPINYYDSNGNKYESKRMAGNIMPKQKAFETCFEWNNNFEKNGTLYYVSYSKAICI